MKDVHQPTQSDVLCGIALTLMNEGKLDLALSYFSAALTQTPCYAYAILGRAITYEKMERFADAETEYGRLLICSSEPEIHCIAYVNRGLLLLSYRMDLNSVQQALEDFERALAIDPLRASAHFGLGVCFLATDQIRESIQSFSESITLEPSSSAYFNRGLAYYRVQEYEQAVLDLQKAITLEPKSTYYQVLAQSLLKLGCLNRALDSYTMSIGLYYCGSHNPEIAEALLNRGLLHYRFGNRDDALVDLRKAINLEPEHLETLSCDELLDWDFRMSLFCSGRDQCPMNFPQEPTNAHRSHAQHAGNRLLEHEMPVASSGVF